MSAGVRIGIQHRDIVENNNRKNDNRQEEDEKHDEDGVHHDTNVALLTVDDTQQEHSDIGGGVEAVRTDQQELHVQVVSSVSVTSSKGRTVKKNPKYTANIANTGWYNNNGKSKRTKILR